MVLRNVKKKVKLQKRLQRNGSIGSKSYPEVKETEGRLLFEITWISTIIKEDDEYDEDET